MRTRNKGYSHYGFEPGEEKSLKELCRRNDFKTYMMIHMAAYKAHPGIADDLAYSLINGLSYDKIEFIKTTPISKVDFYGYQRECLYFFKKMLEQQR